MKKLSLLILFLGLSLAIAQSKEFSSLLQLYEKSMNHAARLWLEKDYAKALDGLYRTSEYLSKHMPTADKKFFWNACVALKTYTIVFARMVETEMYKAQNQEKMISMTKMQAIKWADLLELQSGAWSRVPARSAEEDSLRSKWFDRFDLIIRQARKD